MTDTFDHERLEVYQRALRFAHNAINIAKTFPVGYGFLRDQLSRAATSIVLNIAEGSGKFARLDKRRYYRSASGSASECVAIYDILAFQSLVSPDERKLVRGELRAIIMMLTAMRRNLETRARAAK